ncbi:MAG: DNA repair protein RecO [Eubacteriales bacterium]|nr:DNA repair protein RecO [Eubacteriales bacterium]
MKTDTEGIVLRETKTSYNRRMLLLFTRDYGKISAGTSLGERGKTKSSLALQHFTFGRYTLHQGRSGYDIDSAEVVRSHYGIGEDIDKYLQGSYVLEFTGKVLEEGVPVSAVFDLLVDFFDELETREKGFGSLVLAYQTRLFNYLGVMPKLDRCAVCGKPVERPEETSGKAFLSVSEGGIICHECITEKAARLQENSEADSLLYSVDFGIIDALKYFKSNPLKKMRNLALTEVAGKQLQKFIREYAAYHLNASNIKSEKMFLE